MDNSGLSASDVLSLTKGNDDFSLGGVGGFILLFIFLTVLSGNGFGFGGNGNVNQMATADLLYNQSTDNAIRGLAQGQCGITDTVLNASYNNLLASKDTQYQISNSTSAISNQIANQTIAMQNMFANQEIDHLREVNSSLRDALNNANQTQVLTDTINAQTNTILNSFGKWRSYPPCYDSCGCSGLM